MAQKSKTQNKKSIIYLIIAVLAAILGVVLLLKAMDNVEQDMAAEVAELQNEKVTARIDLSTALVDAENPQFEVYVNTSKTPEKQTSWMPQYGYQGYAIQRTDNRMDIKIKVLNDAEISMVLRGPDKRDENNKIIENWVDYTSVLINGKEILPKTKAVWHNKTYRHMLDAKAGETIEINAKWQKHSDIVTE